ncbi:hypothetical protein [Ornithinimicrobium cryptoxanthini]|uniref:Uncharacterized protein n=1 Tax=Ornithinimicrobium cryptoxanthini TaxID=2934161 RepID=A0ABY4YNC2_9MICO|nr:hypothetical protein [Ornithinimicrobium cryptoxanthini]USQ77853.1 hypothetical protein NF557_08175 [Ornithinimicrobium cryptoxanthini]
MAELIIRVPSVALPASVVLSACGGAGSPDLAGRSFVTETASGVMEQDEWLSTFLNRSPQCPWTARISLSGTTPRA